MPSQIQSYMSKSGSHWAQHSEAIYNIMYIRISPPPSSGLCSVLRQYAEASQQSKAADNLGVNMDNTYLIICQDIKGVCDFRDSLLFLNALIGLCLKFC